MPEIKERHNHEIYISRYMGYRESIFLGTGNPQRYVKHLWRHHWYGLPRDDNFHLILVSPGMRPDSDIYK